jgi:hypothetical protein
MKSLFLIFLSISLVYMPTVFADECSPSDYMDIRPDVKASGMSAKVHYERHGKLEGMCRPNASVPSRFSGSTNGKCTPQEYFEQRPDVARSGMAASAHYLKHGFKLGMCSPINTVSTAATGTPPAGGGSKPETPHSGPIVLGTVVDAPTDFNINNVSWITLKGPEDMTKWNATSKITSVKFSRKEICIDHTKKGKWPKMKIFGNGAVGEGNPWLIVKTGGKWHAATYEWLRPGQVCKLGHTKDAIADLVRRIRKVNPLRAWSPRKGEIIGLMISSLARNGPEPKGSAAKERSNIVFISIQ